jgi:catalase
LEVGFWGETGVITQIEIVVGVGGCFSSVGGEEKARESAREERGMALFFTNVGMISYSIKIGVE